MNARIESAIGPNQEAIDVARCARAEGYSEIQSRLIANRVGVDAIDRANGVRRFVDPPVSALDGPSTLPDIDVAVARITRAIRENETLAILGDRDCDGTTGASALWHALVEGAGAKARNVVIFTSHRQTEAFGISPGLVARLLQDEKPPSLCISVDNGSTDEPQIAELRRHGIETVVADHHCIAADGPPRSAIACINPQRQDNRFPDKTIAGCHVAFLLGAAVRRARIAAGEYSEHGIELADLFQLTCIGTVADVSSFASINNRAIVRAGLRRINSPLARPCWSALRRLTGIERVTSHTLGWDAASRLNASGRVDWATPGIHWLMAIEEIDAYHWMQQIDAANEERKKIQKALAQIVDAYIEGDPSAVEHAIVVDLGAEGHIGVNGLLSGRLAERYGVPAAVLSSKPGTHGTRVGSLRAPPGFHLRRALHAIEAIDPSCLITAGGHAAASGCALEAAAVGTFRRLFKQVALEARGSNPEAPRIESDGSLGVAPTLAVLDEIEDLQPFGLEFAPPTWTDVFNATKAKRIGAGQHLSLEGVLLGRRVDAVWFNAPAGAEVKLAEQVTIHYTLQRDYFRGEKLKIHVRGAAIA